MTTVPEMLKERLKTQTLAKPMEGGGRTTAGDLKLKDVLEIAKQRGGGASVTKMVLGTCLSCGVTVDGRDPREVIKDIESGSVKV